MPDAMTPQIPGRDAGQRFYGKYRGLVSDNADPEQQGRIRARVPAVLGEVDTGWALPALPYSGDQTGLFAVPPVGAGVWIEFEAGDESLPIWSGCWWPSGKLPINEQGATATPDQKILRSEQGLMLVLDDAAQSITLSDSGGSNLVVIKLQESQILIQAAAKVIVAAPQIELTDGGAHPLVFGDNLLSYLQQLVMTFNTHLHPGATPVSPTPPATPQQPPLPTLLSNQVRTG